MPGLALIVFLVVVGLIIAFSSHARSRRADAWQAFATSRQLGFHNGQIAGVVNGMSVALFIEVRGSGKQRHEVAVARCSLGEVFSPQFALERESLADKVVQMVRGPDHQLGDPKLDSAFLLHNVDGSARRVLADLRARQTLLDYVERYPSMRIGNGVLHLEMREPPSNESTLSSFLQDALALAGTLQAAKRRDS